MSKKAWKWLCWNVGIPIAAPVGISVIGAAIWAATGPSFGWKLSVLVDLSPWALAIYALTLLSTTARDRALVAPANRPGGFWLVAGPLGAAEFLLFVVLVIRRHEPNYVVPSAAYWIAGSLALVSVIICLVHRADSA